MKVVAIIQARMGSTRLPGKIMKEVLEKPLLEYQIERVRRSKLIDEIVIATTTKDTEQPIIDLCERLAISFYRGSEENVLSRYFEAAKKFDADVVVRLTSDCPLIDPEVIDKVINAYLDKNNGVDYASNTLDRTYPRGMDTEVFSFRALEDTFNNAELEFEKEHVTPYIYQHSNIFNSISVVSDSNKSRHRWTVDTIEDFTLIEKIIDTLYIKNLNFTYDDILNLLDENNNWVQINANIEQKKL